MVSRELRGRRRATGLGSALVTTTLDVGRGDAPHMLQCPVTGTSLYPTLVLAVRDMRTANGRTETTGEGTGNASWIGLSIAMTVLDTLTSGTEKVGQRWINLLTSHGVAEADAKLIYALRCSLLHGYGPPKASAATDNRNVLLTADPHAHAVDTSRDGVALVSVPVFCGRLVERIAFAAWKDWDQELVNTDMFNAATPSASATGA